LDLERQELMAVSFERGRFIFFARLLQPHYVRGMYVVR